MSDKVRKVHNKKERAMITQRRHPCTDKNRQPKSKKYSTEELRRAHERHKNEYYRPSSCPSDSEEQLSPRRRKNRQAGTSYHVTSDSESGSDDKSGNSETSDDESGNADSVSTSGDSTPDSTSDDNDSDSNFIPKYYFSKDKMPHDLREALRLEVKWLLSRFPDEDKLNLNKTFEQQSDQVNEIIVPAIMESLNKTIFPVTNNVVYSMIHSLHRHRREEYKLKERSPEFIDKQYRRRHSNSRRNSKQKNRAKMINHLRRVGDPLIRKFNNDHLQPIINHSAYHSPEISETDEENPSGKRKIVIRDLKWRSSTCRMFLRNYIDRKISEKSKVPKKRKYVYDNENFYDKEEEKPCNAPKWTCTKYKGILKTHINDACGRQFGNELPSRPNELNDDENLIP
ncbi:unnamed protein product [Rhizophagus irregularis]|nr:unnamed protein product [Rhizophagus irregularis]